jgi:hypothetical protein
MIDLEQYKRLKIERGYEKYRDNTTATEVWYKWHKNQTLLS